MKILKISILLIVFFISTFNIELEAQTYTTYGTNAASTGGYSTYLGYYSGSGTFDGQLYNTLLGCYAGYNVDDSFNYLRWNTLVGYKAGYGLSYNSSSTLYYNILLGSYSGYNASINSYIIYWKEIVLGIIQV